MTLISSTINVKSNINLVYLEQRINPWWYHYQQTEASRKTSLPTPRFKTFGVEYIYGFVGWGVCTQSRWRHSVTEPHTRWRICVTMATLWQQQDGGYMLFYIFNSTVIDWTCFNWNFFFSSILKLWTVLPLFPNCLLPFPHTLHWNAHIFYFDFLLSFLLFHNLTILSTQCCFLIIFRIFQSMPIRPVADSISLLSYSPIWDLTKPVLHKDLRFIQP